MRYYNNSALQDPQIKYPIYHMDLGFSEYILQCKALIQRTRADLAQNPQAEKIIEANTPYELKPRDNKTYSHGALLIHGLLDSPFVMKDIGLHLQSQGCLTRSVLLPGHGTVPGGLLSASYPDWIQAVRYGIHSLSKAVDRIFLVGYSTGGALALHEALQTSDFYPQDKLAGIILLAPAVQIRSQLSRLAKIPLLLNGCWERARWLHIYNEIDYTKYQSITFNSVYQVSQLANLVETLSKNNAPCCPLLVMISQDDKTVSSNATLDYFKQHAPAQSQLVLYTTQPNAANNDSIIQRPAAYPEWNILNMSHIALPVAPDNPHYGRHGDYLYASRIEENPQQGKRYYGSYNDLQATLLDGLYHLGLSKSQKLKLTFNPDFEFLKQMLSEFLEKINSSKKQLL